MSVKWIIILLASAAIVSAIPLAEPKPQPNDGPLPVSLGAMRHDSEVRILAQAATGAPVDTVGGETTGGVNVGRAMLLSAILPGAGQIYMGDNWRGYIYLGIEAAAWALAIKYNIDGTDKDKEFKKYADANWSETTYRDKEYSLAQIASLPSRLSNVPFTGTRAQWDALPWASNGTGHSKSEYLPQNFTHELPGSRSQQYYEMIGKYLTQFGFAWNDQYGDDTTGASVGIWNGVSPNANHYADMRYDSNKLLKLGNDMFMVVMVNHVLSAADAVITLKTRQANNTPVQVQTGLRLEQRNINGEMVNMPTLRVTF